jgi:hypothetical protein
MANANVARGLIPYRHFDGSVWNGSVNMYYVPVGYATALYIGDPVTMLHTQNDANGIPGVAIATAGAGNPIVGSVVGIVAGGNPTLAVTRDLPIYHPASTAQYILVADDPTLTFLIQDDGTGTTLNQWPGGNTNLVSGTGSTTTGYSGWLMSGSVTFTGDTTKQLKVMRLLDQPDNAQPPTANAKWLVKINQHQLANGVAGN